MDITTDVFGRVVFSNICKSANLVRIKNSAIKKESVLLEIEKENLQRYSKNSTTPFVGKRIEVVYLGKSEILSLCCGVLKGVSEKGELLVEKEKATGGIENRKMVTAIKMENIYKIKLT